MTHEAMPPVGLVVPCYNEEARLRRADLLAFVRSRPGTTLCFVDDGSSDGTRRVLEDLRAAAPSNILVMGLARNQGKAEAVRQGVLHLAALGRYPWIGYWDADLSTPLAEVDRLAARLADGARLTMGSRVKCLGATIDRRPWRHVTGRIFATCASVTLRLPVYDSQCGAKLFRAEIVDPAFAEPFMTRWLFDLEILARLRNRYGMEDVLQSVREVPLGRWADVRGSKLRPLDLLRVPFELLRIHARYNRGA